jgi:hypothetical protein
LWPLAAILLVAGGCGFGSTGTFTLGAATVDSSHSCPLGANNAAYDLHASIDSHNGTSSSVSITAVSAAMTLTDINGGWLQQVGYTYDAGKVAFAPNRVAAGSNARLNVTIPSACTNPTKSNGPISYGDYTVALTVATSAGTFKIASKNKHRITS